VAEGLGVTIRLEGDIDLAARDAAAAVIDRGVEEALEQHGTLVIDLGKVTFIDSSGLSCIAQACVRLEEAGERLELTSASPNVHRVLELTGLDHLVQDPPIS